MTLEARRRADWKAVAATLRQLPGQWHRLPEGHPKINPSRLRAGLYDALPAGHFEARIRTDGRQWMRYVGVPLDFMELALDPEGAPRRIPELGGVVTLAITEPPSAEPALIPEHPDGEHDDVPTLPAGLSWPSIAAALRDAPDAWHRIPDRAAANAPAIKSGRLVAFRPHGHYDARSRGAALHARFTPEGA